MNLNGFETNVSLKNRIHRDPVKMGSYLIRVLTSVFFQLRVFAESITA